MKPCCWHLPSSSKEKPSASMMYYIILHFPFAGRRVFFWRPHSTWESDRVAWEYFLVNLRRPSKANSKSVSKLTSVKGGKPPFCRFGNAVEFFSHLFIRRRRRHLLIIFLSTFSVKTLKHECCNSVVCVYSLLMCL